MTTPLDPTYFVDDDGKYHFNDVYKRQTTYGINGAQSFWFKNPYANLTEQQPSNTMPAMNNNRLDPFRPMDVKYD
mgnify:CR=1 FL=1